MSDVVNNPARHRYELMVDGHRADAHYKLDGKVSPSYTRKCRRSLAAAASAQSWSRVPWTKYAARV